MNYVTVIYGKAHLMSPLVPARLGLGPGPDPGPGLGRGLGPGRGPAAARLAAVAARRRSRGAAALPPSGRVAGSPGEFGAPEPLCCMVRRDERSAERRTVPPRRCRHIERAQ